MWLKKKRREEDRERYTVKTGKASRLFQELLPYVKIKHQIITAQGMETVTKPTSERDCSLLQVVGCTLFIGTQ